MGESSALVNDRIGKLLISPGEFYEGMTPIDKSGG